MFGSVIILGRLGHVAYMEGFLMSDMLLEPPLKLAVVFCVTD